MSDTKSNKSGSRRGSLSQKSQKIKNISDLIKAAAHKKEHEFNAERKLMFRPKIHQAWKDENEEDEIEIRRRYLTALAQKEYKETDLRNEDSFHTLHEEELDEINDEKQELTEIMIRLKNRSQREARYQLKIEAYERHKEDERLRKEQELFESEKHNPSKYGFYYTDGYYENNGYFGVKDELLEQLVEEGLEWDEKWAAKYPETFTEKFKRNFWAPKLFFKNFMFRTRGSYLDFPEVIADWPTALDITYERTKMQMLSASLPIFVPNEDGELMEYENIKNLLKQVEEEVVEEEEPGPTEEDLEMAEQAKYYGKNKPKPKKRNKVGALVELGPDDYYYDDETGEFCPKKFGFEVEYHFDSTYSVWRKKRKIKKGDTLVTPYDYYWDIDNGRFLSRAEYQGIDVFTYDDTLSVYKLVKVVKEPLKEKYMIRVVDVEEDKRTDLKLGDYFFDESAGKWSVKKDAVDEIKSEIAWDENGKHFAFKSEGSWRGLTGFSPDDYYFDDSTGKYMIKPARQGGEFKYDMQDGVWKKNSKAKAKKKSKTKSSEYYFDLVEGQFKLRVLGQDRNYGFQKFAKLYYKKPEPKSGMSPDEYYWDPQRKSWLPRIHRMQLMQNSKSKVTWSASKGNAPPATSKDNYYWDIEEGEFFKKDPYEKYHFDEKDEIWKSDKLRDKPRNQKYAGDYFWDESQRGFVIKDAQAPDDLYVFDDKHFVWKKKGVIIKADLNPLPNAFAFDLDKNVFVRKADVPDDQLIQNGNGVALKVSANPATKSPNSFWFDDSEGRFYPKINSDADKYYFQPEDGVWKKKGLKGPSATGFTPRNFYYDDSKNSFKLKVAGQDREYFYDKGNKIFRHVTSLGKTRNGLKPEDFRWNTEIGLYVSGKDRSGVFSENLRWDPERKYDKPWLLSQSGLSPQPSSTTRNASVASRSTVKTTYADKKKK